MSSDTSVVHALLKDIESLSVPNQSLLCRELRSLNLSYLSDEAFVDAETASAELLVSPTTLSIWRCTGRYNLAYHKIGRLVRYKIGDLRAFKEARRVSNPEAGPSRVRR